MSSILSVNANRECFKTMANECKGMITEFLGLKKSVLLIGSLNKSTHAVIFSARNDGGYLAFSKVSLVAHKAIAFLNSARQPKAIKSLRVIGSSKLPVIAEHVDREINRQSAIRNLSFGSAMKPIPFSYIKIIIEAIPNLNSLSFSYLSLGDEKVAFEPTEENRLSAIAKANLDSLTALTINTSSFHPQGIIDILGCSNAFKSVFFQTHTLSDDLLITLSQKQNLQNLSFASCRGQVNYAALDSLQLLEYFTPGSEASAADLIRVSQHSPLLKDLDLKSCNPAILTEEVLKAIGENLVNLERLHFPRMTLVTETGFVSIAQGCKKLMVLGLEEVKGLTANAVSELISCPELTNLNLSGAILRDECLAALATVSSLTHLNLSASTGFTTPGLGEINILVNLLDLDLSMIRELTNEIVDEIVFSCPRLSKLAIENCNNLNQDSLIAISQAINAQQSHLKQLNCIGMFYTDTIFTDEMIQQLRVECPDLKIA